MKILQIFGWVVAVHLFAFVCIFASPGCQSGPRSMPTPDATVPIGTRADAPVYAGPTVNPQPVDLGTAAPTYTPVSSAGHATPTRPGSAAAVAVTPAKPVAENVAPVSTYTVERGDSLWSIAKKNGLSVAELAKANSVTTGTALKPGRKLIIPGKVGAAPKEHAMAPAGMSLPTEKTTIAPRPASGEAVKHTVQVGESLGVIARKYSVSVGELAAANNITDPSKVRSGQQLIIPGMKAVATKSPAPAAAKTAAKTTPAATTATPAETPVATPSGPHFDLTPPPPGQDLDSGLKSAETEVPTIKVEDAKPAPTAK